MASAEAGGKPVALRRARLLRRDRRPRLQEDLPVAPGHGPARDLTVPVIGVAKSGWTVEQLRERARASLKEYGGGVDEAAFAEARRRCSSTSTATTATRPRSPRCARRSAARSTRRTTWRSRPASSARSSSSSASPAAPTAPASSSRSPSATTTRPPRALNKTLHSVFPESVGLPHRPLPRQGGRREPAVLPVRQHVSRADLEPQLRGLRADHDGRGVRRPGPRQVLRRDRRDPRRHPEPPAAGRRLPRDGAARSRSTRTGSATSRSRCSARSGR